MSKNALNSVKVAAPSTNAFDMSHDVKLSMQMGDLVPVLAKMCMPGDRWRMGCEHLVRLAPMLAPMMHRVDVRIEYFFVPNRLIWEGWETFITNGGDQPAQVDPLPSHPFFNYSAVDGVGKVGWNKLMDYMGLPDPNQCPDPTVIEKVSALALGAYQKIYDDYYRDENLIESDFDQFPCGDGDNTAFGFLFALRKRCWEADYFTKALPFAQKGQPVDLPLGTIGADAPVRVRVGAPGATTLTGAPSNVVMQEDTPDGGFSDEMFAKMDDITLGNTTINDLRLAYRLQEWLEKNARGGTRYSELIRSHFNVRPQDARLQRAEYVVGVKNPIAVSEVLNMTGTDEAPQGTMAGHGVSYSNGNYGKYFCSEHGWMIGIMSVMPKTAYQQGIPKEFLIFEDPTDYPWPTFANLGEQEISSREIMAFSAEPTVFGYTPRYMEHKQCPNRVAGQFRSSLDFWTMVRIFDPLVPPVLNSAFVTADPTQRVFAVEDPDVDQLYCQVMHHLSVVRPLPFYGTPTF